MSTLCPAWILAFFRKYNAEIPPNMTAAASSSVMLTGLIASPSSAAHTYSAWLPNLNPFEPNTWSPTANRVTTLPTDSIVPANSIPNMLTFVGLHRPFMTLTKNGSAFLSLQSAALTVVAWTRSRTSLSLGAGLATSRTWTTSGDPYLL